MQQLDELVNGPVIDNFTFSFGGARIVTDKLAPGSQWFYIKGIKEP